MNDFGKPAIPETVVWPLTEAQSGLWYAQQLAPDNPSFNTAHALWIDGPLDVAAFTEAANQAAREAQSLSLAMRQGPNGPEQWLDPARTPWLELVDLSREHDPRAAARAAMQRDMATPLAPASDPLARQQLYILGPQRFAWYQRAHHLTNDGYGMALWTTRVCEYYANEIPPTLQVPLDPLLVVIDEDQAYLHGERRAQDGAFWREAFTPMPEVAGMAAGRAVSTRHAHRQSASLPPAQRTRLLAFAQQLGQPWPDVATALTALYCLRMAGAAQTVVGVPYMNRLGRASARATATVMNVLPLALAAGADDALHDFIQALSAKQLRARRHGRFRSEQLRRDLGLLGGQRRLHGALINVQPFYKPVVLPGVSTELEILGTGPVDDITIGFRGDGSQMLDLEIEANPDLYSADSVAAHLARLPAFLDAALGARTVGDIPLASPAEAQRYLFEVNATAHAVPAPPLTALIEAGMARDPQAIALEFEGEQLSYAELDVRTRALAGALRQRGVAADALVAVALPRSLELLIALVAVLRAGGAYLPLDLAHPAERLARVVALAGPRCALVHAEDAARLPDGLDCLPPERWPAQADAAPLPVVRPTQAAYVIYTSGSTGEPKGVMIEHRAIVNRLEWMRQHYGFAPGERILQKTPATFDVSVWEFFLPLITGCTLVIAPPEAHRDPAWLTSILRDQRIGTCHFVPSMLSAFLATPGARGLQLQRVFCSGEELPAPLRDRFHATLSGELHNLYGPTEAAVDVSYWPAGRDDHAHPVPIGFPVWNTWLYVLDERMRPLPPGVAGDLYLGGVQLARGYLGRDDLTAERFLADPHRPGERIYKTGDLARWREDGAVIFLGRSDHQVKLRGLRIELGEIEAAIAAYPHVVRGEVIVREDRAGDKRLVAYVQPRAEYDAGQLRVHIAAKLPDYMVPSAIVELEDWPVTANGKLDRKALPAPTQSVSAQRPPQTATEQALARLYAEVLGLAATPGAEADFFDLGGDSLAAVDLMLRIQEHWQRNPGLGTLFATPTVEALAAVIDHSEARFDSGLAPLIQLAAGDPVQPPLFVIHPAGGIAWGYRHLAQALARPAQGPSRSVFGLQSPALAPGHPLPHDIDALAEEYARRALEVRPHGPIHLLGWSVGGIIAQAMAVALSRDGHEVGLVAMLDAYPSDAWRAEAEPTPAQALRALLAVAGIDPDAHLDLTTQEEVVAFLRQGDSALGHLPVEALEGVVRVVTDTNRLIRQHHHQRHAGSLLHVRAGLDHADKPQLQAALWQPYAQHLETLEIPMLHAHMTGPEASALIAPMLLAKLSPGAA
ncbi:MAG: non-ribosomal peptide synthetase [Candidatus Dactylopiibacterium carminicum]|uniref:Non-ribosomal peptide synthetase n=1 Tax=Candidatus Dactylopiibacterium carminicum TaxID=857335 RepID=A0A272EXT8_9RHOO|nr:non-ribosomal peptide synthetase [Candidatus Dactylopiibacterium carminicum]KAF7600495.1 non-ribosomal peptide synthetase [Candidatus Dactylopiibacterium carminicum]PAS94937.1 MAG: non-ribosomal peptide synthetase [Candidatus Dactylopiibacterium carminicum]PAS98072.1 MAG: non-ribosomal peptide synthetase [Candidatus Dactylopiibacterium carminicum]PAT00499.1 MAG: non-ribosomal peptide synthetase [Candidatus Dactylopiibacterium carminicum]